MLHQDYFILLFEQKIAYRKKNWLMNEVDKQGLCPQIAQRCNKDILWLQRKRVCTFCFRIEHIA